MRTILLMIGILIAALQTQAQAAGDTAALLAEIRQLQAAYQARPIAFEVKYTYASELSPQQVLDSLQGRMELAGASFHYWLDSMETISNGRYNISLFKEDKIMYLSRPSALAADGPLQQVRSLLERSGIVSYKREQEGNRKWLRIGFKEGSPCRQMDIAIDPSSGYITSLRYVVKTELLMDNPGEDAAGANATYGEYAIVQTTFDRYREITADSARFDERRFFYKDGAVLKTTPAYNEYKIFTGSPNL